MIPILLTLGGSIVFIMTSIGFTACAGANQLQINPKALEQIQALEEEKAGRTPVQQKISSQLLYALKMQRGESIAKGVPTLHTGIEVDPDGTTLVEIKGDVTQSVLTKIKTVGGTVIRSHPTYRTILAHLPLENIEQVAELSEVTHIGPAIPPIHNTPQP